MGTILFLCSTSLSISQALFILWIKVRKLQKQKWTLFFKTPCTYQGGSSIEKFACMSGAFWVKIWLTKTWHHIKNCPRLDQKWPFSLLGVTVAKRALSNDDHTNAVSEPNKGHDQAKLSYLGYRPIQIHWQLTNIASVKPLLTIILNSDHLSQFSFPSVLLPPFCHQLLSSRNTLVVYRLLYRQELQWTSGIMAGTLFFVKALRDSRLEFDADISGTICWAISQIVFCPFLCLQWIKNFHKFGFLFIPS